MPFGSALGKLMRDEHTINAPARPPSLARDTKVESPAVSAIRDYINKTSEWDKSLLKQKEVA